MDSDSYDSSDEMQNNLIVIQNLPKYIINLYESNLNKNTLLNVQEDLLTLIEDYDIHRQINDYRDELIEIYNEVVKDYLKYECPLGILDQDRNFLINNFVEWAYENTNRGLELDYIEKIYYSVNINLSIE
jgi:hypothetical protein